MATPNIPFDDAVQIRDRYYGARNFENVAKVVNRFNLSVKSVEQLLEHMVTSAKSVPVNSWVQTFGYMLTCIEWEEGHRVVTASIDEVLFD